MAVSDGRSKFLETLRDAQAKSRAVAVYAESDDFQSYEVGFVEHADGGEIVLLCLTPKGEADGRRSVRLDDVARVDFDTAYTRKLELLYQFRDTIFDKDFKQGPGCGTDLRSQLEHAKESHTLVHVVDSHDYGPSGFVRSVGKDYVEIERIGPNGEPDGVATILSESITKIHLSRRQEQVLEFLHRYNFELKRLLGS